MISNKTNVYLAASLVISVTVSGLNAGEPVQSMDACQMGFLVRSALQLGPDDLASLGVDQSTHLTIVQTARTYCEGHAKNLYPLIAALQESHRSLFHAYEFEAPAASEHDEANEARFQLRKNTDELLMSIRNLLPSGIQNSHVRLMENDLTDPCVGQLNVTAEQRASLLEAENLRNATLWHHRNRKDPVAVNAAMAAYEASISQTLTAFQLDQLVQIRSLWSSGVAAAYEVEQGGCPAPVIGGIEPVRGVLAWLAVQWQTLDARWRGILLLTVTALHS